MTKLLEHARDSVLSSISQGDYQTGQSLPSVDELAVQMGCSQSTVDRALRQLAKEGVVHRVRNRGTIVAPPPYQPLASPTMPGTEDARANSRDHRRVSEVCLLLSDDSHTNDLLMEPVETALKQAGLLVIPQSFTTNIALLTDQLAHHRARAAHATSDSVMICLSVSPIIRTPHSRQIINAVEQFNQRIYVCIEPLSPTIDQGGRYVSIDPFASVRLVIEHLRQSGHRSIAISTGHSRDYPSGVDPVSDFCRHMLEFSGIKYIPFNYDTASLSQLPSLVREQDVTALWATNDHIAMLAMNHLQHAGLRVPTDVAVVGRNNTPWCQQTAPNLSSISLEPKQIARAIVELLQEKDSRSLNGDEPDDSSGNNANNHERNEEPISITIDPKLIIRGSSDFRVPDDSE